MGYLDQLEQDLPMLERFHYFEWGGAGQILCANETNRDYMSDLVFDGFTHYSRA